MTEVLQSPSHFASSPSPTATPSVIISENPASPSSSVAEYGGGDSTANGYDVEEVKEKDKQRRDQLSLLALLVTLFRKSLITCKSDRRELCALEIGWPTNVRHVAHVTFDRFNGFLGLPVEFEPDVPRRAPSASASVFGVSTESMQLSYDPRGNSVPTILLLMQRRLYSQGGLQAEGIFRINAENGQEEYVRDQLNRGLVPQGIDVHCLAGLIKAWFRELPTGVLDCLSPEEVMQSETEEECAELVRHLPLTEAALLNWAINLMADVAQQEHLNKMNARNIAMVFAPNMTQMADPLTALMYAVQVMNFLKTLIIKALREREESAVEPATAFHLEPSDKNGHQSPSETCLEDTSEDTEETEQTFVTKEPAFDSSPDWNSNANITGREYFDPVPSINKLTPNENGSCDTLAQVDPFIDETVARQTNGPEAAARTNSGKNNICQSSACNLRKGSTKINGQQTLIQVTGPAEKTRGISNLTRIDSRAERIEAWW